MKTLVLFALTAVIAQAQPNSSQVNIIPKPDGTPGVVKWWAQKVNVPGFSYTWTTDPAMAADVISTWPTADAAGFLYSDGAGVTSWLPAGTCGVSCVDLTSAQTIVGEKTFDADTFISANRTLTVGTIGGAGATHLNGVSHWYNSAGVSHILLSQGGASAGNSGIIRTSNATDTINSLDQTGIFSAVGFNVGTFASKIPIVDAAGLVTPTSFQYTPGAVAGYCFIADAVGVASWAACSAGGSFITTNTPQTGLTGDKQINSGNAWTFGNSGGLSTVIGTSGNINQYDASGVGKVLINYGGFSAAGIVRTFDPSGNQVSSMDNIGISTNRDLRLYDSVGGDYWVLKYGSSLKELLLTSGGGSQTEMRVNVFGTSQTQWGIRGTLFPLDTSGANGDIGYGIAPFRAAYFSATVNAATFAGTDVILTGAGSLSIGSRLFMSATTLNMRDSGGVNSKILMTTGGTGSGIIRTFDNAGTYQNSMEANGIQTNVGFVVGPFAGGTTVITAAGGAIFSAFRLTASPSAGYIMTADASGNGTWQAPAGGSFVTTNTNQTGLSGTKGWSNLHTFNGGVEVKLLSTARDWYPEADDAYNLGCCDVSVLQRWKSAYFSTKILMGSFSGLRSEITPGSEIIYNSTGARRVQIVQPGASSAGVGIVRALTGAPGFETIANSMDATGFDTTLGYRVNGTVAIDGSRNTTFAVISGTSLGVIGSVTGGSGSFNNLVISTGATTGFCWTATSGAGTGAWQACGSGSFITTNTSQTGLTGAKQINAGNVWTWGTAAAQRFDLSGTSFQHYNGGNALKIQATNAGASTAAGIFRVYQGSAGSETVWVGIDPSGITVNGSLGINLTCSGGNTVRNPVYVFGILTAGTCAP